MLKRRGDRELLVTAAASGKFQCLADIGLDPRKVVARIHRLAIEHEVLARMDEFLRRKSRDLVLQLGGNHALEIAHGFDEEALALRKRSRKRVVEGCGHGVSTEPPAGMGLIPAKGDVARTDDQIGRCLHFFAQGVILNEILRCGAI